MEKSKYKLVWAEEFNYKGPPDPAKWSYQVGGHGWGNDELQYYTEGQNVYVDGEKLIIEARKEEKEGREITSTRMRTVGKGDWTYGLIEVRAKLPKAPGTWPAIWMMPSNSEYGNWPSSGEIDIMEHLGRELDKVYTAVHTEAYNHKEQAGGKSKGKVYEGISDDFHVFSLEWLPDKLRFMVDGEEQFVYNPRDYTDKITYREWPYDKPFHIILNLAFGGWGAFEGMTLDVLPARFEVDYVRVYQRL